MSDMCHLTFPANSMRSIPSCGEKYETRHSIRRWVVLVEAPLCHERAPRIQNAHRSWLYPELQNSHGALGEAAPVPTQGKL